MSHTPRGPWLDREPHTVLLTAYVHKGAWRLVVQEHLNTVASALRPDFVHGANLWSPGRGEPMTNRDLLLAVQDTLTRMLVQGTTAGSGASPQ